MNERIITTESIQADHQTWLTANDQWREDVDRWQAEHESALTLLIYLQDAHERIRRHHEAVMSQLSALESSAATAM